jgi:hypothetical protein
VNLLDNEHELSPARERHAPGLETKARESTPA